VTFIPLTTDQRSDAWRAARLGRVTGSCAADMLSKNASKGEAAGRRNLRVRLVLEQLTGQSQEDLWISRDMQRGIELEPTALLAYEVETGRVVRPVGFLAHPTLMAGCSPDGVVGSFAGIVEVKVPKSATHLEYLRGGVPGDYLKQCQHNLWITGAAWCDFVSFDPRFPEELRLKITRITMDEAQRRAYELMVCLFLSEVERERLEVQGLIAGVPEGAAA